MSEHPIILDAAAVRDVLAGVKTEHYSPAICGGKPRANPFGQAGDQLWVREKFATRRDGDRLKIRYAADGSAGEPAFFPLDEQTLLYVTERYRSRPAHLMPRWAARIVLAVVEVTEGPRAWRVVFTPQPAAATKAPSDAAGGARAQPNPTRAPGRSPNWGRPA